MSTTFIKYKQDKGFWISEMYMQLAFHYIRLEVQKSYYLFFDKVELLETLEEDINGLHKTYMALMWHDLLNGASDEETMIEALQNVIINLQAKGTYITADELQAIDSDDFYFKTFYNKKPYPTFELIKIIDALVQIMKGTWTFTNYNMEIDYKYSPE